MTIALAVTGVLVTLASRYGPHRDELYFVAAGHHPAWGYPNQPPLTPLVAALADSVAPGNLVVLRLPSAVLAGAVVMGALTARELGGGRAAQVLMAVLTGTRGGNPHPRALPLDRDD